MTSWVPALKGRTDLKKYRDNRAPRLRICRGQRNRRSEQIKAREG